MVRLIFCTGTRSKFIKAEARYRKRHIAVPHDENWNEPSVPHGGLGMERDYLTE